MVFLDDLPIFRGLVDIPFFLFRHQSEKRIRQLPEIDGLSKDTVVTSWMAKYDALMKGKKSKFLLLVFGLIRRGNIICG